MQQTEPASQSDASSQSIELGPTRCGSKSGPLGWHPLSATQYDVARSHVCSPQTTMPAIGTGPGSCPVAAELGAGGTDCTAMLEGGLGSARDPAHAPSAKLARIGIMNAIGKLAGARRRWGCVTMDPSLHRRLGRPNARWCRPMVVSVGPHALDAYDFTGLISPIPPVPRRPRCGHPALLAWLLCAACSPPGERVEPWTPVTYPYAIPSTDATTPEPSVSSRASPGASASAPPTAPPEPEDSVPEAEVPTPSAEGEALRRAFAGRRPKRTFVGDATYYHDSLAGNPTACGETYAPTDFTAAHRSLPFGTILRVVHPSSGRDVFVRVNDRGPFGRRGLVLDLSRAAAEEVGLMRTGVMKVRVEVMEFGSARRGKCGRLPRDR